MQLCHLLAGQLPILRCVSNATLHQNQVSGSRVAVATASTFTAQFIGKAATRLKQDVAHHLVERDRLGLYGRDIKKIVILGRHLVFRRAVDGKQYF